ncbi:MAG: LysE family transporter [Bacteroidetes bacterium]|nr:LysE family transporter [Bacteroidota bacterium]
MFESSESLLAAAFVLGFTAGISPGVLFALIISESIQHGAKAGIKVAIAPFITDLPIVLLSLFVFQQLSQVNLLLALISFAGGLYLAWLGYKNIVTIPDFSNEVVKSNSIRKGVVANFLAPGPYVFWMSLGAPLLTEAFNLSVLTGALFIIIFYTFLVGMKITIAIITANVKKFIGGRVYVMTVKILGMVLIGLGVLYIYNGYLKL